MPAKKKLTRVEKSEMTRNALLRAAAEVVGELGYKNASITAIAQRAGVANGTFYNYFETRQDLFDILLPSVGQDLLDYIRDNVDSEATGPERERHRYRAYVRYCAEKPGYNRLLDEAVIYAPVAFATHMQIFTAGYVRALKRSLDRGELGDFSEADLPAVVFMLMGARSYFSILNEMPAFGDMRPTPQDLEATYLRILENGLFS